MKATILGKVLAEAPEEETVPIEGNVYFPPTALMEGSLHESSTPYTCPWKGVSQYYSTMIDGQEVRDVGWSYPRPLPSATNIVGRDFAGYVAFSPEVRIDES
jgi:uncharacterized protein (DUF427 family)